MRSKPDWFLDSENQLMKSRFIMFRRGSVFYAEETATGKQTSLRTKDEAEAITLLNTKNEATRQPAMNLQIAQVYLQHADPTMAQRTWQNVMDAMFPLKTGPTQARWQAAMRDKAYDLIRSRKLIETGRGSQFSGASHRRGLRHSQAD